MIRNILVKAVANGWIVEVGCQTFVYDNMAKLTLDFQSYLMDPHGTEKRIMESAVNAKHTMQNEPTPCCPQEYATNAVPTADYRR
jgi:hypothetical protein